jgi:uncharacterized LabA/DUF88 family protein
VEDLDAPFEYKEPTAAELEKAAADKEAQALLAEQEKLNNLPKIGIFVDIQNIYYTTKQAFNRQFNYRQFWQDISYLGDINIANAYAIASNNDGQRKFQDALRHIGFDIKLKPFIQRSDGSAKGDWDVGITVDIMEAAEKLDHIILLSGDGDFDLLMHKIKEKYQVKTQVIGVQRLTAQSLIKSVDQFTPIESNLLK